MAAALRIEVPAGGFKRGRFATWILVDVDGPFARGQIPQIQRDLNAV
jgi:hypothetical protein